MKLRSGTTTAEDSSSKIQNNSMKKAKDRRKTCLCAIPQTTIPLVLSEFRENTKFCDGIIICDNDVKIKVHRVVLSSASPYFKAHFTNTLNRGSCQIIEAKVNVPSNIFTKLLDFAYTGYCSIDEDNVQPLLRAADQYSVLGVIPLCCRYIADRLQPTNCLEIVKFARQYSFTDLEKEGRRYVSHNFLKALNDGEEFDNLTMKEVINILEDDELNVKNEEFVYNAVRRWINVNPNERKSNLLYLLKYIRIGNLSTEFLTKNVLTWSLVAENMDCQSYLMGIIDTTKNNADIDDVLWRPRVPYDILFLVGGWDCGRALYRIETYDSRSDRWLLSVDTDNVPRARHGVCALNGYIYMIGGYGSHGSSSELRRFDPVNHKWLECACMHYCRIRVSVVMHDNKIYAIGGQKEESYIMNSAERYDPRYNQWELIKPMHRQRADASAAVLKDKIYIVGGENENRNAMNSAEMYDTLADQWTFIPPMLSARWGASLVAYQNTIYALGGITFNGSYLSTGEKFTPGVSPGWEAIKEMFRPRTHFATSVLDDRIFVIGGFSDNSSMKYVEYYNTDTNEWMDASPMNMNRAYPTACVLSGLPNARDYSLVGSSKEERRIWLQDKLKTLN